jgi:hypothetical protein
VLQFWLQVDAFFDIYLTNNNNKKATDQSIFKQISRDSFLK